jgi:threonine aldolase
MDTGNKRGFASDNNSGVHPEILEAMIRVNQGHVKGYGDDQYTKKALSLFKEEFGEDVSVFFVFNGTGANVLSISVLTNSFHSVLCPATAHIMVDECGAPEKITGCKLIAVDTPDGKLTPDLLKPYLHGFGFEHHSQPRLVSISQVTEMGTLYSKEEILALSELVHSFGMYLHLDGARIANAAVALGLPFKDFTREAGVDVVSFGGTKNGMMFGEAVLFFNPELTQHAPYFRKQNTQLYSKMRYISAQFIAYFENKLWLTNAKHSNRMASLLEKKVRELGIPITQKVEANGVFAIIPDAVRDELQKSYFFYPWNENRHEVRWMTSFDTHEEEINDFCYLLNKLLQQQ